MDTLLWAPSDTEGVGVKACLETLEASTGPGYGCSSKIWLMKQEYKH